MTTWLPPDIIGDGRTIVALATAPGRGALALIRASGPGVRDLAAALLDPVPIRPRYAIRSQVRNIEGIRIDDVIVTLFLAPLSFTGEDVLEISTHGGSAVAKLRRPTPHAADAANAPPSRRFV